MNDLLQAADNIRALVAAFDGLRTLGPVLERVGSLEQAADETAKAQAALVFKITAAKNELEALTAEVAGKTKIAAALVAEAQNKADTIVRAANDAAAEKLKECNAKLEELVTFANAKADEVEKSVLDRVKDAATRLEVATKAADEQESRLATVREAIAKLTNG